MVSPTRLVRARDPTCPFCHHEWASARHLFADCPHFEDDRKAVQLKAGFDAGWEIDLFGRVRRGVEAAGAEAGAAQADLRDAQVTVAAEVARNYLELRGAQARLKVAYRNLETQRETLRLTKVRFDAGAGGPIDVASAQARLNATEAAIPGLITAEKRANYRLAVLTGQRPGALDALLVARATAVRDLAISLGAGSRGRKMKGGPHGGSVLAGCWK